MNISPYFLILLIATLTWNIIVNNHRIKTYEHARIKSISYQGRNKIYSDKYAVTVNAWYQDSLGISEICSLSLSEDTNNVETVSNKTVGYRFFDLRKKMAYDFANLSDTAKPTKKYFRDTARFIGGYNFFHKVYIQYDSLNFMPDTIINKIKYLRLRYRQSFRGNYVQSEALFRCDKKQSAFQMDLGLRKLTGCPMVKAYSVNENQKYPAQSAEIEFLDDVMPDSVKRVFKAWEHNTILSPVQ